MLSLSDIRTGIMVLLAFVLCAGAIAQTPTPSAAPRPPKFILLLETQLGSDEVTARIGDHRFQTVDELKAFIPTLPPRARIVWTEPPGGTPPAWRKFTVAWKDLKEFCAAQGMTFIARYPYW